MNKTELLDRMETARAEWERILVQLGEPNLTAPLLPNGQSVKDVVAHVMVYERWTAAQLSAQMRGTPPTPQEAYGEDEPPAGFDTWDMDARNLAVYEHYRDRPLADIIGSARQAFDQLADAVRELPEEALTTPDWLELIGDKPLDDFIAEQSFGHYQQHLPELLALRERVEGPLAE